MAKNLVLQTKRIEMRKVIIFLYWLPAIAWMWAIYHYSTVSWVEKPKLVQDKAQHAIVFFIMSLLIYVALQHTARRRFFTSALIVLGFCTLYAAGIQLNQIGTPSRTGDFDDWLTDVGGSAMLIVFLLALRKIGSKGKAIYSLLSHGLDKQTNGRDS